MQFCSLQFVLNLATLAFETHQQEIFNTQILSVCVSSLSKCLLTCLLSNFATVNLNLP